MAGYGSDSGMTTWAAEEGYTIPSSTLTQEQARQRGSVYVDGLYEKRVTGNRVTGLSQERAWPRKSATDRGGASISASTIPDVWIKASYFAALQEMTAPGTLAASARTGRLTKREAVSGAVSREFFQMGDTTEEMLAAQQTLYSYIENILWPLLYPEDEPQVLVV